jgi:hypothetical protein
VYYRESVVLIVDVKQPVHEGADVHIGVGQGGR